MYEKGREKEKHFIIKYENMKIFKKTLDKIVKDLLKNEK